MIASLQLLLPCKSFEYVKQLSHMTCGDEDKKTKSTALKECVVLISNFLKIFLKKGMVFLGIRTVDQRWVIYNFHEFFVRPS